MKRNEYKTINMFLLGLTFTFVCFISIGYSAINADLMISGDLEYYMPKNLYDTIASKSKGLDTSIDFSVAPTASTSGVYKMNITNSDKYPVYYYRGIVSNNNVKFANFCWKMVRTTSTGGVKLIYNGVSASNGSCDNEREASTIGEVAYNTSGTSMDDVNYVYDNGIDSNIKKTIDEWYKNNMTSYTGMLEDTEWCNDRSVYKEEDWGGIYFGAYGRNMVSPYKPSIVCPNASDKYTVSSSKGNGKLKYPVALLTADEVTLAGHSSSGYLDIGVNWWLMSPGAWYNGYPGMFFTSGHLAHRNVIFPANVRVVVSLAPGTTITGGNGSVSTPYTIGS